jgi:holo-[acyl-carrier-protein] synthase
MGTCLGVDIQQLAEVERSLRLFGSRYLEGVYDEHECRHARAHPQTAAIYLASRFAAREAVCKLLQATDVLAIWSEVLLGDVVRAPEVRLRGEALELADARGISTIFLSIALQTEAAFAVAIADCE